MKYVDVGGDRISAIGVGCWQFGSKDWGYGKEYGETTAVEIVHTALDLGVNLIDTAEVYARGVSETIVGRALIGRRAEAFVATKFTAGCAHRVAGRRARPPVRAAPRRRHDRPVPDPLAEPGRARCRPRWTGMRTLLDEGVVANVGVSATSRRRPLGQAAEPTLGAPVLSNQVQFCLLYRKPDRRQRAVRAGPRPDRDRVQPARQWACSAGSTTPTTRRRARPAADRPAVPAREPRARRAADRDAAPDRGRARRDPAQVALAWLIRKPNVVVIPGASSVDQLRHNVGRGRPRPHRRRGRGAHRRERRVHPDQGGGTAKAMVKARRSSSRHA